MSTGLLVGIDLLFTVLLLLAVLYVLWGRGLLLRTPRSGSVAASGPTPSLDGSQGPAEVTARSGTPDDSPQNKTPHTGHVLRGLQRTPSPIDAPVGRNGETGRLLAEAVELLLRGLSPEEIARRLKASTGEVQMVLSLHRMEAGNAHPVAATARNVA